MYAVDWSRNIFLVDDRSVNYEQLYQERMAQAQTDGAEDEGGPVPPPYDYPTNVLWIEILGVTVNGPGDMVAGFSGSSASNYIGAFYTLRSTNGATTEVRQIQPGTIGHSGDWGDYSATTLDPTDNWSFWTVQEFAKPYGIFNGSGWATVIAKIRPNP